MGLDFRVLGPLEVARDGTPLRLGGPKQRALLALLLLEAGGEGSCASPESRPVQWRHSARR